MIAALTLLAPLLMAHAHAREFAGRDEFGRRCALVLEPSPTVMIEDEWFGNAGNVSFTKAIGGRGRTGRVYATLVASDGTTGELDLALSNGRATSFTLTLTAASYYVHSCRIDP